MPGDLTPVCASQTFNAFLRDYLDGHDVNGASFVQRNLRNLFKWLEKETGTPTPFGSEDTDRYVAREHKPKILSREFIKELLGSCESATFTRVRDEAIICLLLGGTSCRRGRRDGVRRRAESR
jgi:site-specific recombinase XerD